MGQELLQLLDERSFPLKELRLLASARSAGRTQTWQGSQLTVQEVVKERLRVLIWCWLRLEALFRASGVLRLLPQAL